MRFFADIEKNTEIWWAVCSLDKNPSYGAGGLSSLSKEHKKAEIGFWLFAEFWKKGIMTELVPIICNYGFKNGNFTSLGIYSNLKKMKTDKHLIL